MNPETTVYTAKRGRVVRLMSDIDNRQNSLFAFSAANLARYPMEETEATSQRPGLGFGSLNMQGCIAHPYKQKCDDQRSNGSRQHYSRWQNIEILTSKEVVSVTVYITTSYSEAVFRLVKPHEPQATVRYCRGGSDRGTARTLSDSGCRLDGFSTGSRTSVNAP